MGVSCTHIWPIYWQDIKIKQKLVTPKDQTSFPPRLPLWAYIYQGYLLFEHWQHSSYPLPITQITHHLFSDHRTWFSQKPMILWKIYFFVWTWWFRKSLIKSLLSLFIISYHFFLNHQNQKSHTFSDLHKGVESFANKKKIINKIQGIKPISFSSNGLWSYIFARIMIFTHSILTSVLFIPS